MREQPPARTAASLTRGARLQVINRFLWMGVFLPGAVALAWAEWHGGPGSDIGWFLALSLWSMVCAIGYSAGDWLVRGR